MPIRIIYILFFSKKYAFVTSSVRINNHFANGLYGTKKLQQSVYLSCSLQRLSHPPRGAKVAEAGLTEQFSGMTFAKMRSQVGFSFDTEATQNPWEGVKQEVEIIQMSDSCQS